MTFAPTDNSQTEVTTWILSSWADLLNLDEVRETDTMLGLGANSIQVIRWIAIVAEKWGVTLSLRSVLHEKATTEVLAGLILRKV